MAYHEISTMDIWEVIRRWHSGQAIRHIARTLGYDRKTIQRFTRLAASLGLSPAKPLPRKEDVVHLMLAAEPNLGRSPQAQTLLRPFLEEIVGLVNDPQLALKPKSAFQVVCERHDLTGKVSYTSFKRFVRTQKPALLPDYSTCRIEALPGSEVQIDYAKVCMLYDPTAECERTLYVFIATLAHSRLKYIEPTFKQDQTSFVSSHFEQNFEDQASNWVKIAGKSIATDAERFQWNRSSTGKWVNNKRRLFAVGSFYESSRNLQIGWMCRVIPVGEIGNELQQLGTQVFVALADITHKFR